MGQSTECVERTLLATRQRSFEYQLATGQRSFRHQLAIGQRSTSDPSTHFESQKWPEHRHESPF
jgi:hypothetical protein